MLLLATATACGLDEGGLPDARGTGAADAAAIDTLIDSAPAAATASALARFEFSATEDASFACQLDAEPLARAARRPSRGVVARRSA